MTLSVDLNCDMGEGMGNDTALLPFISSANIACGAHAGDRDTMRRTVEEALRHGVAIGAHPSYADRESFGRIDRLVHENDAGGPEIQRLSDEPDAAPADNPRRPGRPLLYEDLQGLLWEQLYTLQTVCREFGTRLHHVKPHGALYNRAARDKRAASLICHAIQAFDPLLFLYGLSGSEMAEAAGSLGLAFVHEVFADRTYQDDGQLTPRTIPGALIEDEGLSRRQALQMVREGNVVSLAGNLVKLRAADSICLHGDGVRAVESARLIYQSLLEQEICIRYP